jgi:hypothetical protein
MFHMSRRRRWQRQRRLFTAMAALFLGVAGACFGPPVFKLIFRHTSRLAGSLRTIAAGEVARPSQPRHGRPVYPYSVIRGGAYSGGELVRALDVDPVAARHYAGFQRSLVHTTASRFSEPVFLSYRVGEVVYWTNRPVRLPAGETLLTDGKNYARARCGNRISLSPQTPVNDAEPAPTTLDQPRPPADASTTGLESWAETRLVTELSPPFALVVPASGSSTGTLTVPGGPLPADEIASWFSIGTPSGFLYIWDVVGKLTPNMPPADTGNPGIVIQPNPIPGLIFPNPPGSGYTPNGGTPDVPGGSPPLVAMVPPGYVPPGYAPPGYAPQSRVPSGDGPPGSTVPGFLPTGTVPPPEWFPAVPANPGTPPTYGPPGSDTPIYPPDGSDTPAPDLSDVPDTPIAPVPEPGLLAPTILAALALGAALRRTTRPPN